MNIDFLHIITFNMQVSFLFIASMYYADPYDAAANCFELLIVPISFISQSST